MVTVGAGTAVTVTLAAVDVEAPLAESPPYAAVMECPPTARALVVYTAIPVAFNVIEPRAVVPSLNVTVPVGTLDPPTSATVAVKLIAVPAVAEVGAALKVVVVGVCTTIFATKASETPPPYVD
jgi:hypothetical protein